MQAFRFEADELSKKHDTKVRVLSWGAVAVLFLAAIAIFFLGVSGRIAHDSNLKWLFVFAGVGAPIGVNIIAFREGLRRAEREMVFILDDAGIVRRRDGYPDIKISFSEFAYVGDELRWLVIESVEPRRKIAIPNEVAGFEVIRDEIIKHHPLDRRKEYRSKSIVLPITAALSWAAVLLFHDVRLIVVAGAIALITLLVGCRRFWSVMHEGPKRVLMWVGIGCTWITAILLICIRIVRPAVKLLRVIFQVTNHQSAQASR